MGERVFSRSPVRAEWPLIKKKTLLYDIQNSILRLPPTTRLLLNPEYVSMRSILPTESSHNES